MCVASEVVREYRVLEFASVTVTSQEAICGKTVPDLDDDLFVEALRHMGILCRTRNHRCSKPSAFDFLWWGSVNQIPGSRIELLTSRLENGKVATADASDGFCCRLICVSICAILVRSRVREYKFQKGTKEGRLR